MTDGSSTLHGTHRALSAFRWLLVGNIASRLVVFAASALLARKIHETELGVYRQMLSLHAVLFPCLALGLDQFYIRSVATRPEAWRSMKRAAAFTAIFLSLVMLFGSPWILKWMELTQWPTLVWLFPLVVIMQAAKVVWKTPLVAELDFRTVSLGEFFYSSVLLSGAVIFSWLMPTAIGLYFAFLIAEALEGIYVYYQSRSHRREMQVQENGKKVSEGRSFATWYTMDQLLFAAGAQSPVFILGMMNLKAAAAAYTNAVVAIMGPLAVLLAAVSRITLPDMARLDASQVRSRSLTLVSSCAWMISPVLAIAAAMGDELTEFLFSAKWVASAGPMVSLTAAYICVASCLTPLSSLDVLRNKIHWGVTWNLVTTILRVVTMLIVIPRGGIIQAVLWFNIVSLVSILVWGWVLSKLVPCSVGEFFRAWWTPLPVWIACYGTTWFLISLTDHYMLRLLTGAAIAAAYYGLLVAFHPRMRGLLLRVARP